MHRRTFLKGMGVSSLMLVPGVDFAHAVTGGKTSTDVATAMQFVRDYLMLRSNLDPFKRELSKPYLDKGVPSLGNEFDRRDSKIQNIGLRENWNGQFISMGSSPKLLFADSSSAELLLGVRDRIYLEWVPNGLELSAAEIEKLGDDPKIRSKYGISAPPTQVTSMVSADHIFTLSKWSGGWIITNDQFFEPAIGGKSSNFQSDPRFEKQENSPEFPATNLKKIPRVSKTKYMLGKTFDYMGAVNYANLWANGFNTPIYSNISPTDCANFVSQCFIAGGYPTDSSWYKNSATWVNNLQLRNWLISSGRGISDSSQSQLGYADIVNFKSSTTLQWSHVAIVTRPYSLGCLISCHSNPQLNVPLSVYGSDPSWAGMAYASTYLYY